MGSARTVTALVSLLALVAACGGSPASAPPSVAPTPRVTPNPHLPSPATAQEVFSGLGKYGLRITANTATLGTEDGDVVRKVYATYLGWPLDVTEYRDETALTKWVPWKDGDPPGKGEPPIALAGMNILITWGPTKSGAKPGSKLSERHADALEDLLSAANVLLSPLKARTSVPVRIGATAAVEPAPSPAPSTAP
jgi:hypothetical protein